MMALVNPFWDTVKEIILDKRRRIEHAALRDRCCDQFSFAVTGPVTLRFVARWVRPRAIEIGAGTRYWAWLLTQMGIDILAFDIIPDLNAFIPIQCGGPELLPELSDTTLFLCLPPFN